MRIAVDAMGSDNYPSPDVEGAVQAARMYSDEILLVGDRETVETELKKHDILGLKITIVHASEIVEMTDKPSVVGKTKPDSSMHIGMNLVKDGEAQAFVTAGNTGAALTIAMLYTLHRIPAVKRPALSSIIRVHGNYVTMVDIGANTDSKPEWMVQFALMGDIYARKALKLERPRVALLSNGEEKGKGNQAIQETYEILQAYTHLNFVGNIEPKDILNGKGDVVVSDGFIGNITVKSFEAFGSALSGLIRSELKRDPISAMGGLLARRAFARVSRQIDPFEIGGAPLLGVNGVVIIGHGRSNAQAIRNAINQARLAVSGDIVQSIRDDLIVSR
ncbi:MAG: phosphate acyltransferase PlsX [Anaerolineaceae bacterium]|nr:phosphate acyltransferase PlsX [Anaerolineaceae bacterium]